MDAEFRQRMIELDEIGFIGSQEPVPVEEKKRLDEMTSAYFREKKAQRTEEEQRQIDIFTAQIRAGEAALEAKRAQQRAYDAAMELFRLKAFNEVSKQAGHKNLSRRRNVAAL
jgi:hypothetical protein